MVVTEVLSLLSLPFAQRALIGGLLVAVLAGWMGILVVLRRSSFFGDAVSHASLLGVALGLLLGVNPVLAAAAYAVGIAFLIPKLRDVSLLPTDSLLGIILPVSMAGGVVVLSALPGYQPELMSFLFGSILSVSWIDISMMIGLALAIALFGVLYWKKLLLSSLDPVHAQIAGVPVERVDALYHVLLALTIVVGIQVVGIILVNALLIIPASTVRLFARSLRTMAVVTPMLSALITLIGLLISFVINVPSGPAIALVAGGFFVAAITVKQFAQL